MFQKNSALVFDCRSGYIPATMAALMDNPEQDVRGVACSLNELKIAEKSLGTSKQKATLLKLQEALMKVVSSARA